MSASAQSTTYRDSPDIKVRLLGIKYIALPRILKTKRFHTKSANCVNYREFEVKRGMLRAPVAMSTLAWDAAKTAEMKDIGTIDGKT